MRPPGRANVQIFSEGQQFVIGGRYGVLAMNAGGDGEVVVGPRLAYEPQGLVGQGEIIINKFPEFSGIIRRGRGCAGHLPVVLVADFFLGQR